VNAAAMLTERRERCEQMLAAARRRLDKETIHQLRVSIRRLQAALRLMRLNAERRALKPLMQLAGEVRNRDIAIALAAGRPIATEFRRPRRQHAAALKQALLAFTLPPTPERPIRLSRHLLRDFFRAGRRAAGRPTAERLHALRLAGKRLRYAIEILAPSLDASTPARLKELKQLQDHLGEANDCASARLLAPLAHDEEFHAYLDAEQARHSGKAIEIWQHSFGVLGARESWQLYFHPRGLPPPAAAC